MEYDITENFLVTEQLFKSEWVTVETKSSIVGYSKLKSNIKQKENIRLASVNDLSEAQVAQLFNDQYAEYLASGKKKRDVALVIKKPKKAPKAENIQPEN